jgi:hypothetical protein
MDEQEPGLTLDESLAGRLQDYAQAEGMSNQDALETALGLGLELCAAEAGRREQRLRDLESGLRDLMGVLEVLGPPVLGILRLLVAWAAREGFAVSEDELLAELATAAREEWALAVAEHGVILPPRPTREA